ncbi:alanine racemase [Desulfosarcina sp.]|uniref:alanine racemase n=1 Tax=Desulfosarcina sp. TaxID=2027861 RepID=UPI003970780B
MSGIANSTTFTEKAISDLRTWVEIDLSAVQHNIGTLRKKAGPGRLVMACVKSNAYGHGLVEVARAAEAAGVDRLAVAQVDEGLVLRQAGLAVPIQVLMEPSAQAVEEMRRHRLIASLSTPEVVHRMATGYYGPLTVHIEVDTGMGRVPLQADRAEDFLALLKRERGFNIEGIFSHFACAGKPGNPFCDTFTYHQLNTFTGLCDRLAEKGFRIRLKHIAGSDAVAFYPRSYLDMIRPGAWVYGYKSQSIGLDLKPVLSWKTKIFRITAAPAGRPVGYEMAFRPSQDTRIAHLPVGYGDGYPRALSNCSEVLIKGQRAPVVGLIGMESMIVDVGHIPGDLEGQEAVLIGCQGAEKITAAGLAKRIDLFAAMITCGIKESVPRIYKPAMEMRWNT